MFRSDKINEAAQAIMKIHGPFTRPFKDSKYGVIVNFDDKDITDICLTGAGVPSNVFHQRAAIFWVSPKTVPELLQVEVVKILPLFQKLQSYYLGYKWDGSNMVGDWIDDPDGIHDVAWEIQSALETVPVYWDAGDFLALANPLDLAFEGDTITEIASRVMCEALSEGAFMQMDDLVEVITEILTEHLIYVSEKMTESESGEIEDPDEAFEKIERLLGKNASSAVAKNGDQ